MEGVLGCFKARSDRLEKGNGSRKGEEGENEDQTTREKLRKRRDGCLNGRGSLELERCCRLNIVWKRYRGPRKTV